MQSWVSTVRLFIQPRPQTFWSPRAKTTQIKNFGQLNKTNSVLI